MEPCPEPPAGAGSRPRLGGLLNSILAGGNLPEGSRGGLAIEGIAPPHPGENPCLSRPSLRYHGLVKFSVLREFADGERRTPLSPDSIPRLTALGVQVAVEAGAGEAAGFTDEALAGAGAEVAPTRAAALQGA